MAEVSAYIKAHSGKINLASFGTGTIPHVAGILFKTETNIEMTHVPYRGSAPLVTDLLSGQVQSAFDNLQSSIAHIKEGKLRALAVTTTTRSPSLPDVPTLGEFLPGYEANAWIGIGAPRGTPVDVIAKLNKEINRALTDSKIAARIADLASTPFIASPAELDKLVIEDTEKWGHVIRGAGVIAKQRSYVCFVRQFDRQPRSVDRIGPPQLESSRTIGRICLRTAFAHM